MVAISWVEVGKVEITDEVIHWPWKLAAETLHGLTHVQIKAEGEWEALGAQIQPFNPDGHAGLPIQTDRIILSDCPIGAVIGKVGGSSANFAVVSSSATPAAGTPFPVGAHCVAATHGSIGPLFIGFNWMPRPLHIKTLKITVSGTTIAQS